MALWPQDHSAGPFTPFITLLWQAATSLTSWSAKCLGISLLFISESKSTRVTRVRGPKHVLNQTIHYFGCVFLLQWATSLHLLHPEQAAAAAFPSAQRYEYTHVHGHSHEHHCQVLGKSQRPQLWESCREWLSEGLVNQTLLKQSLSGNPILPLIQDSSSPSRTGLCWKQFSWFS